MREDWIVVGISGVTCGGKTTLAETLKNAFNNTIVICQDDYFLPKNDSRHVFIPELNYNNWDILAALDMNKMKSDINTVLSRYCVTFTFFICTI